MKTHCPNGHSYAEVGFTMRTRASAGRAPSRNCRACQDETNKRRVHTGRPCRERFVDPLAVELMVDGVLSGRASLQERRLAAKVLLDKGRYTTAQIAQRVGVHEITITRYAKRLKEQA